MLILKLSSFRKPEQQQGGTELHARSFKTQILSDKRSEFEVKIKVDKLAESRTNNAGKA